MDSHIYAGYTVPPYYDSMLGKLIVHGQERIDAIRKMRAALDELLEGIPTTLSLYREIFRHAKFVAGNYDTSFASYELGL